MIKQRIRNTPSCRRNLRLLFVFGVVCLGATLSQAVQAIERSAKVSQKLVDTAQTEGQVRVIVMLDTNAPTLGTASPAKSSVKKAAPQKQIGKSRQSISQQLTFKNASRNVLQRMPATGQKIRGFKHFPLMRAEVDAAGLEALMASPEVRQIVEDKQFRPTLAESIPLVEAAATQSLGFSGQGQTIAVLDTGVDASHPFLSPRVVEEACFSSNSSSTVTVCPNGQETQLGPGAGAPCNANGCNHGTHVTGISAGNGATSRGVAPEAQIIAVQVFSRVDSTNSCLPGPAPCTTAFLSDIIAGLERVFELRNTYNIAAVNMSLGGGSLTTFCDDDPVKVAIDALRAAGIASIISSGNEGETNALSFPACISSSVSVGSTTKSDTVSGFSNSATFLTLLAPGSQIRSSVPGGGFDFLSGTSMAAPHVAGAFAAIRSANPQASVDDIISALSATGLPITDSRNQIVKPRIRLNQAIAGLGNNGNAALAVQPLGGLTSSGEPGGPFTPAGVNYTLTNNGSDPLPFEVSTSQPWLSITPEAGTLAAGQSTQVSLNLSAAAEDLLPGVYSTSVLFDNTTGVSGDTLRTATLTVQAAGSANDKFSNGVLLTVDSGSTLGSNVQAGKESGEPNHAGNPGGASIWWQWVAPANGSLSVDTAGSDFDTVLGVYTGNLINILTEVASDDDAGPGTTSAVTFDVTVGTTYRIAVDGFRSNQGVALGNVALNWRYSEDGAATGSLAVTPVEGLFATGGLGGPFTPSSKIYTLTNTSAGIINFDILTNGSFVNVDTSSGQLDAGESTTIAVNLTSAVSTLGPGTNTASVIINGISRTIAVTVEADGLAQNDFADRAIISGSGPLRLLATNTETDKESGEPDHASNSGGASIWWRWTAPSSGTAVIDTEGSNFDTLLAAYTGDSLNNLIAVASNDDSQGLQSRISFSADEGRTYAIAVDGFGGETGSVTLNLETRSGRPNGDDFNTAQPIEGGLSLNDTLAATAEPGEPLHAGVLGGKSVWWRWQATATAQVTIDTLGSDFDTVLAVYTGDSLETLNSVAFNDDTAGLLSEVSFNATPGTTYFVAVDGFAGASGSVRLNVDGAGLTEQLLTSTLPTSRSVRVGDLASVFATLINTSADTASNCSVAPDLEVPASFTYLQTEPGTNQPIPGTEDQPFTIASGGIQTLVMAFTASEPLGPLEVPLVFECANTGAAKIVSGLNTVVLSASNNIVADVVALAATSPNPGVVNAGPGSPGAFSVATVNIGATEVITATPTVSFTTPSTALSICQTNSATGACLSPPTPSVTTNIDANTTPTFSVFVSPSADIVFDPAESRIQVVFSDPTGNVRGSTSVAVSTN